jgi:hypothetical protein
MAILSFTSCQSEVDEVGRKSNTNTANSTTTTNLKRTSMYDGSFDDFGWSFMLIYYLACYCKVNGVQVSILSQVDYNKFTFYFAKFNDDQDTVVLQFPLKIKTSNYTEVTVTNQTEYNAILNACSSAEASGQDAISSVKFFFPITILTYNLSLNR